MSFILKFERRFIMAHRLYSECSPKCVIPHGHNEYIRISLAARDEKAIDRDVNMVAAFHKVKSIWHHFIDNHLDHTFQLRDDDPLIEYFKAHEEKQLSRIVTTPGDPTTECMCACLMAKLQTLLDSTDTDLECVEFELEETPTNTVILAGANAYEKHLPQGDYWYYRADNTINNF